MCVCVLPTAVQKCPNCTIKEKWKCTYSVLVTYQTIEKIHLGSKPNKGKLFILLLILTLFNRALIKIKIRFNF